MAATSSPGLALLEQAILAHAAAAEPSEATLVSAAAATPPEAILANTAAAAAVPPETVDNASEIELLVFHSLRKLGDYLSSINDQADPCDLTKDHENDEGDEDTEADASVGDGSSTNGLEEDTAQDPSDGSGERPEDDPASEFEADPTTGTPLEQLQHELAASFSSVVLKEVREALLANDSIRKESRLFGEPLIDDNRIRFCLSPEGYQEWLQHHQMEIATKFTTMKGGYKFISKKRAGDQHFYLQCHRAGAKREVKGRVKGGKSGKPRVRSASIKVGCPSKLRVETQKRPWPDGKVQTVYQVTYLFRHNHGDGCFSSEGVRQKFAAIRATIKNLILGGSIISMAFNQLMMNHDEIPQILEQKGGDDFITYGDIYNIWHDVIVGRMRRDVDPIVSSVKWMEKLEEDGAFTYYDKDDHRGGLYFGFSTAWQMSHLKAYGQNICLDGTHNVFGQDTHMFTLVVKNDSTGFAVPVAFLLTRTAPTSVLLVGWLRALKRKMTAHFSSPDQAYRFKPNAVITDQGNEEILAINRAFTGENVSVFFCAWHAHRVWEREIRKRVNDVDDNPSVEQRKATRDAAVSEFQSILKEPDVTKALQGIQQYREKWSGQHDLLTYLNSECFGSDQDENSVNTQKRWMICYREGVSYSPIETNDYMESWHNILGRYFFKDRQQGHPDTVIYLLAYMVIPYFRQKCDPSMMRAGRMTPTENGGERHRSEAERHLAVRESSGVEGDPVVQIDENTLRVESFTTPDTHYDVHVEFTKFDSGEITSCSCPYFGTHPDCCKHIALVLLLRPQMRLKRDELDSNLQESRSSHKRRHAREDAPEEPMENLKVIGDSVPEGYPPHGGRRDYETKEAEA
ncbi:hypothetical protein DFQ27_006260 [Actinomortierella ambigua]|uniref:SWIM-type domain-containing protein n=1 Tax=Actinomortierella ambigua TaxID=1343610 RepID=A0A9P6QLP6_9FUNG|nr:hypothetical protein DFQ27_006260 [Actinomortierella ambigua]